MGLFKRRLFLLFFAVLFFTAVFLSAQVSPSLESSPIEEGDILWYRSNSAGMTLEEVDSQYTAMRNEYYLSVKNTSPEEIPWIIKNYYEESFVIELRILYENREEFQRQWVFRDDEGYGRVYATGSRLLIGGPVRRNNDEEEKRTGFIELRDSGGTITREFHFDEDGSEWDFRHFFNEKTLIRSETWFKAAPSAAPAQTSDNPEEKPSPPSPPVFVLSITDSFRYSRTGSMRVIDRYVHKETEGSTRFRFPRLGPGAARADENIKFGSTYTSVYFLGNNNMEGITITYNLDTRGRIITETCRNEERILVGTLTNTWSGDRLDNVRWKTSNDERRIEFDYDNDGNRTAERNLRNGILERVVTNRGDREIEELYMNGKLVLRAVWEDDIKISEERISTSTERSR